MDNTLKIAMAQIAPVWLNKTETLKKVEQYIKDAAKEKFSYCSFETLNVMDKVSLTSIVEAHGVTQIYHLAAILSAAGEKNPLQAWDLNMVGLLNVDRVCVNVLPLFQNFVPNTPHHY